MSSGERAPGSSLFERAFPAGLERGSESSRILSEA